MIFIETAPELLKLFMGVAVGGKKASQPRRTHTAVFVFLKTGMASPSG
jgi:hypothetical protein